MDLARLSGPPKAQWFDPTNGASKDIDGSALPNQGVREFFPPGRNAAGEDDWVLMLKSGKP